MKVKQNRLNEHGQGNTENYENNLRGFGGVLILLAIGLGWMLMSHVLYVLQSLIHTLNSEMYQFLFKPQSVGYEPIWGIFIIGEIIISVFSIGILIYLAVLMFRHKKAFKPVAIFYLIANVAISIYSYFILSNLTLPAEDSEGIGQMVAVDILRAVVIAVLVIAYLLRSRRVKNTYIR